MTTLMDAHKEWRDRPASERFETLADLHAVTLARRQASHETVVRTGAQGFRFEAMPGAPSGQDLVIRGENTALVPTAYAMDQLTWVYKTPGLGKMVSQQPAALAAQNLNWAMEKQPTQPAVMLWANGGDGVVRGFTTPTYSRLWDSEVVSWVRTATDDEQNGWHRPPALTDTRYPSGYYASDRDVFMFLVNDENRIDDGSDKGLGRGFIVRNTEVGGIGFSFSAFLYRYVCGNHMIWGHQKLFDFKAWHMGKDMSGRVSLKMYETLGKYLNAPAAQEQATITLARTKEVGKGVEGAIKFLTGAFIGFNKSNADAIVTKVVSDDGNPTLAYDLFNGATSLSQKLFQHNDERYSWDKRAANIIESVAVQA